jgi:sodium-independent sulfate anion transporter 11
MGALTYWIFGTSKDINIGPVAVLSMVTGTIVAEAKTQLPEDIEPYVVASALAILSGALVTLIGLLRLGFLIDLIALPAVSAFITGSAVTIGLGQVPTLLGIHGVKSTDAAYLIAINTCKHLHRTRMDAATGLSALAALYIIKYSCERGAKRWPSKSRLIFFASTLRTVFIILLFTLISYIVNRNHQTHPRFSILGFIPRGKYLTTCAFLICLLDPRLSRCCRAKTRWCDGQSPSTIPPCGSGGAFD